MTDSARRTSHGRASGATRGVTRGPSVALFRVGGPGYETMDCSASVYIVLNMDVTTVALFRQNKATPLHLASAKFCEKKQRKGEKNSPI